MGRPTPKMPDVVVVVRDGMVSAVYPVRDTEVFVIDLDTEDAGEFWNSQPYSAEFIANAELGINDPGIVARVMAARATSPTKEPV